jgi:hypothetical protein
VKSEHPQLLCCATESNEKKKVRTGGPNAITNIGDMDHSEQTHSPVNVGHPETGRTGRGSATMTLPGETEAALRGRNHAEG